MWEQEIIQKHKEGFNQAEIARYLMEAYPENFVQTFEGVRSIVRRNIAKSKTMPIAIPKSVSEIDIPQRFMVVADTHMGSKDTQITALHEAYEIAAKEKINDVIHLGDLTEGIKMRLGHEQECYIDGVDEMVFHVARTYPQKEGIVTYFITGNHDESFAKIAGVNIGRLISSERKDMIYLGHNHAEINCEDKKVWLRHPGGGGKIAANAMRRIIDGIRDPADVPDLLLVGHFHKATVDLYKKCTCIAGGAFQRCTGFMSIKVNTWADVGCWIIDISNGVQFKWIEFEPIKDDWKGWT